LALRKGSCPGAFIVSCALFLSTPNLLLMGPE
jgi:hypothetical protein